MTKKTRNEPKGYRVWLTPDVHKARKRLPGNIRHRIRRSIDSLRQQPRPAASRTLSLPEGTPETIQKEWEIRRARIEDWRIVYAIREKWKELGVLMVAKRPPYRYEDLEALLQQLANAP